MSPETETPKTKICPTCGTRLSENAVKCPVCGTELEAKPSAPHPEETIQAGRMPEIRLSLPVALGLLTALLLVGALAAFLALRTTGRVVEPTPAPSATPTTTITPTPTETPTPSPVPTPTPLPPFDYTVAAGDTCAGIAATFGVSVQSIIILNNLPASCNNLYIGQVLKIPYPTPTVTPPPTATLQGIEATQAACEKAYYTVQENDTLSSIAANYNVPQEAIKAYNGLATDTVFVGTQLTIPLCERFATPGPTPTPTPPPGTWTAAILSNTSGAEPGGGAWSILTIEVAGLDGLTVQVRSEGGFETECVTGSKPELGAGVCQIGGLWPATYHVQPLGLPVRLDVTLDGRGAAHVAFWQQ